MKKKWDNTRTFLRDGHLDTLSSRRRKKPRSERGDQETKDDDKCRPPQIGAFWQRAKRLKAHFNNFQTKILWFVETWLNYLASFLNIRSGGKQTHHPHWEALWCQYHAECSSRLVRPERNLNGLQTGPKVRGLIVLPTKQWAKAHSQDNTSVNAEWSNKSSDLNPLKFLWKTWKWPPNTRFLIILDFWTDFWMLHMRNTESC